MWPASVPSGLSATQPRAAHIIELDEAGLDQIDGLLIPVLHLG